MVNMASQAEVIVCQKSGSNHDVLSTRKYLNFIECFVLIGCAMTCDSLPNVRRKRISGKDWQKKVEDIDYITCKCNGYPSVLVSFSLRERKNPGKPTWGVASPPQLWTEGCQLRSSVHN